MFENDVHEARGPDACTHKHWERYNTLNIFAGFDVGVLRLSLSLLCPLRCFQQIDCC